MKHSTTSHDKRIRKWLRLLAAAAFWLLLWHIIAVTVNQEILIVSPLQTAERLALLASRADFWFAALMSIAHIMLGLALGIVAGVLLAALTEVSRAADALLSPMLHVVRATPVASFIILALVWISSARVPAFISFLMVLPVIWGNVRKGINSTDPYLLEMGRAYGLSRLRMIGSIYAPSVMPYFMAGCTTAIGLAWKAGIAAEVIAITRPSIGEKLYNAKIYLETPDLFAWTVVIVLLSVIIEKLFVLLMKKLGEVLHLEGLDDKD